MKRQVFLFFPLLKTELRTSELVKPNNQFFSKFSGLSERNVYFDVLILNYRVLWEVVFACLIRISVFVLIKNNKSSNLIYQLLLTLLPRLLFRRGDNRKENCSFCQHQRNTVTYFLLVGKQIPFLSNSFPLDFLYWESKSWNFSWKINFKCIILLKTFFYGLKSGLFCFLNCVAFAFQTVFWPDGSLNPKDIEWIV